MAGVNNEADVEKLGSLLVVLVFSSVHLFVGRARFTPHMQRLFMSAAAGVSLAYVFGHLFPELPELERELEASESEWVRTNFRFQIYFVAMLGLIYYWATSRAVQLYCRSAGPDVDPLRSISGRLHFASYASYCFLIGYHMVHWDGKGPAVLAMVAISMGMHFFASDHGLLHHYHQSYNRTLRWWFSGATLLGWIAGVSVELPSRIDSCMFAFAGGGIILHSLREEVPDEELGDIRALAGAAGLYSLMIAAISRWKSPA